MEVLLAIGVITWVALLFSTPFGIFVVAYTVYKLW
jgi:hypothetical protein